MLTRQIRNSEFVVGMATGSIFVLLFLTLVPVMPAALHASLRTLLLASPAGRATLALTFVAAMTVALLAPVSRWIRVTALLVVVLLFLLGTSPAVGF